jgi:hypothetical protein
VAAENDGAGARAGLRAGGRKNRFAGDLDGLDAGGLGDWSERAGGAEAEAVSESGIELVHPDGARITIYLPAAVTTVASALMALGELGFELVRDDDEKGLELGREP